MVRNTRGGNKHKKQASSNVTKNKKLIYKEDEQWELYGKVLYGKVLRRLGGTPPYILVLCSDKIERKCVVRGKFNKKVWMQPEDIVLITYDIDATDKDSKGEILHKYDAQDIPFLKKNSDFNPNNLKTKEELENNDDDNGIVFTNDSEEEMLDSNNSNNLKDLDDNEIDLDEI